MRVAIVVGAICIATAIRGEAIINTSLTLLLVALSLMDMAELIFRRPQ